MISRTLASAIAGSVGGAVGVGVSFPLDTIKTKTQVMRRLPLCCKKDEDATENSSMIQAIRIIYQAEGLGGFYSGCRSMMMGQAVIKAISFTVNALVLAALLPYSDYLPHVTILLMAACTAGLAASFVVAPVERVKVMMQANGKAYANEFECIRAVVEMEGWSGLFKRGLRITMAREVPSDGVYFALYGYLSQSNLADHFGASAPLIFGAMAGCASWCPVYPIDTVKTIIQNTEGGSNMCSWKVATDVYRKGGLIAFYDGFAAKMMRAAVFHSMTFFAYELVLDALL
jgi:solute carrier family 25 carnitine/acylcarnitine transporter 20/29